MSRPTAPLFCDPANGSTVRFGDYVSGAGLRFVEGLGSGRVPHLRPTRPGLPWGVHPDFLSSSLALTNFMRFP